MTLEGELVVRLEWDGRRVRSVAIRSTRPFAVARVVSGKRPAEAAALVPLLFSVCGGAQGAAASTALDAAGTNPRAAAIPAARETVALLETVQEYLWRLLIDWPRAMDQAPAVAPVAAARQRIAPVLSRAIAASRSGEAEAAAAPALAELIGWLEQLAAAHVYGMPSQSWLALGDAAALGGWTAGATTIPAVLLGALFADAPQLGHSTVALMPAATREAVMSSVMPAMRRDRGYARAPMWDGAPAETGALARMHAHPLVAALRARDGNTAATRMVARLAELSLLLARLRDREQAQGEPPWVQGFASGNHQAFATVQTARGLLLHWVRLDDGKVADYEIVAPTEWNFHHAGALAEGLAAMAADDEATLVRRARIAIQALDPCVACRVEVGHA